MKRNPLYSPNANSDKVVNINGIRIRTQALFDVYLRPGKQETKQEKFNRIFQVEDAKLVK